VPYPSKCRRGLGITKRGIESKAIAERELLSSHRATTISLAVGIIAAALTLALYTPLMGSAGRVLSAGLFPGILGSVALAGNAHAFRMGKGAAISFILYFGITWVICKALAGIGKKLHH
jgi:hypothetical protein